MHFSLRVVQEFL